MAPVDNSFFVNSLKSQIKFDISNESSAGRGFTCNVELIGPENLQLSQNLYLTAIVINFRDKLASCFNFRGACIHSVRSYVKLYTQQNF